MRCRWLLWTVALVVALGCRGASTQGDDLMALVDQCKADAAKRADVDVAGVQVTKVEAVVWRDGSLGCPKPDMEYIMMLIPGYRMTLQAGGRDYEYHTDKAKRLVCCEGATQTPAEVIGPVELPGTGGGATANLGAGVLYLEPIPDEPNLNSKLVLLSAGGEKQTVVERCTAFIASPQGWILAKERTSRSGHDLLLARVGEQPRTVLKAFDFEGMAISGTDSRYAVLVRPMVGAPYALHVGSADSEAQPLDWAPSIEKGYAARLSLADNLLLVTVPESEDDPPSVTLLDLQAQKVVASFRSRGAELYAPESVRLD